MERNFLNCYRGHGILESSKDIGLFDNDLPVGRILKINSITLVIKSLIEKNNKFYPEIALNHCMYKIRNMLEYDRIDLSEGIDIKRCEETSRECSLCKFYYFLNKNFNYQRYLCDGCHYMSIKEISMQSLVIVYHGENAYRINFMFRSKNDAFNLIKNSTIIDKKGIL